MKQDPLFSILYILGTGMAIAMVMVMAVLYYIKVGDIYPEIHRSRTMVAVSSHMQERENKGSNSTANFSIPFIKECFYPLEGVEAVSAFSSATGMVIPETGKRRVQVTQKKVDVAFWKVFEFEFLHGAPFTKADFESGTGTVVISDKLSRRLYGTTEAVGRTLKMDTRNYRICGVVVQPSYAMKMSYADVWMPYTCNRGEILSSWLDVLGSYQVAILLPQGGDAEKVNEQVDEFVRKFNQLPHRGYELQMHGQPYMHWKTLFYKSDMEELDYRKVLGQVAIYLVLLLLVPTLNLSGMIASRMERRLPELGVRKAFGASKGKLFTQVVWENLLLTVLGGVLGLLLTFGLMVAAQNWLLTLLDGGTKLLPDGAQGITWDMLFNPTLFLLTFVVCVLLNLLSALVPAALALRKNIVYSLSKKQ